MRPPLLEASFVNFICAWIFCELACGLFLLAPKHSKWHVRAMHSTHPISLLVAPRWEQHTGAIKLTFEVLAAEMITTQRIRYDHGASRFYLSANFAVASCQLRKSHERAAAIAPAVSCPPLDFGPPALNRRRAPRDPGNRLEEARHQHRKEQKVGGQED
jgi:hypothetical protein